MAVVLVAQRDVTGPDLERRRPERITQHDPHPSATDAGSHNLPNRLVRQRRRRSEPAAASAGAAGPGRLPQLAAVDHQTPVRATPVSPQGLAVQPVPGPDLGEHPAARVARPELSPTSRPTALDGSAREQVLR
jgi:hypothetical protein